MSDKLTLALATRRRCEDAIVNLAVSVVEEYERLLRLDRDASIPGDLGYLLGKLTFAVDKHTASNIAVDAACDADLAEIARPMGVRP